LRSGFFVDQKWINLVPCLFNEIHILRNPGCNVAYWNLHERFLTRESTGYVVNGNSALTFFHYSGYSPSRPDQLSRKLRVPQHIDDTLKTLLFFYGERLQANGADSYQKYAYAYKCFSNGLQISSLVRRLYSVSIDRWGDQDPFDANGEFYVAAKKAGLLSKEDQAGRYSTNNLPIDDMRIRTINRMLFALPKIIGGDRYTMLMKYLSFITILRNQRQLLLVAERGEANLRHQQS
jgi:hypothetical protein